MGQLRGQEQRAVETQPVLAASELGGPPPQGGGCRVDTREVALDVCRYIADEATRRRLAPPAVAPPFACSDELRGFLPRWHAGAAVPEEFRAEFAEWLAAETQRRRDIGEAVRRLRITAWAESELRRYPDDEACAKYAERLKRWHAARWQMTASASPASDTRERQVQAAVRWWAR